MLKKSRQFLEKSAFIEVLIRVKHILSVKAFSWSSVAVSPLLSAFPALYAPASELVEYTIK